MTVSQIWELHLAKPMTVSQMSELCLARSMKVWQIWSTWMMVSEIWSSAMGSWRTGSMPGRAEAAARATLQVKLKRRKTTREGKHYFVELNLGFWKAHLTFTCKRVVNLIILTRNTSLRGVSALPNDEAVTIIIIILLIIIMIITTITVTITTTIIVSTSINYYYYEFYYELYIHNYYYYYYYCASKRRGGEAVRARSAFAAR